MIRDGRDLLGRQLDDRDVRQYLEGLGHVTESGEDEEQGPEHYAAVKSAGLEVMSEGGIILAVTLYRDGHQGYAQYPGSLPLGLTMHLTRPQVRALLGAPQFAAEAGADPELGHRNACDRYDRADFGVALDYDAETEEILAVQLLVLKPSE